jgi:hypothetical protein
MFEGIEVAALNICRRISNSVRGSSFSDANHEVNEIHGQPPDLEIAECRDSFFGHARRSASIVPKKTGVNL